MEGELTFLPSYPPPCSASLHLSAETSSRLANNLSSVLQSLPQSENISTKDNHLTFGAGILDRMSSNRMALSSSSATSFLFDSLHLIKTATSE